MTELPSLSARYTLEYPYHRSVGPVLGRFLAGMRDRRVLGIRAKDGRVIVPPQEYDPQTGDSLDEIVEVAPVGAVRSWTWIAQPRRNHPMQRPFAFALVKLDGADTAMLHLVDAANEASMRTGMRVRARWREARVGAITDIECFELDNAVGRSVSPHSQGGADFQSARSVDAGDPVTQIVTPVRLDFTIRPGRAMTRYLTSIAEGRLVGQRGPSCRKVYVPPRGSCPTCAVPTEEEVELAHRGTVTSFCIVRVPYPGQQIKPPYVSASILLDGADIPFYHLIQEMAAEDVRMGLRVEAVWAPPEERGPTAESIRYFRPTGEPDAPYDSYKEHL
jgi:uncharacterized OB-fold protein